MVADRPLTCATGWFGWSKPGPPAEAYTRFP